MNNIELVHKCMTSVVQKENFIDYNVQTPGQSNNGDGYLSSVIFITVVGTQNNGQKKTLNYVAKISNSTRSLREKMPIAEIFRLEMNLYEKTVPAFRKFQKELGLEIDLLDLVPNCHFSDKIGDQEIVILDNMRSVGFVPWEKFTTLSHDYMKVMLESYGKWHAFSFALKHKNPEAFRTLENGIHYGWYQWIRALNLSDVIFRFFEEFRNALNNEKEIIDNLKLTKDDALHICTDLFHENPEDYVIIHGDGWVNNYLFKVENSNKIRACILDWQFSAPASPAFDLSYFIYACVDTEKYQDVDVLLQIYYASLSDNLKRLGCDATKVFPYDRLKYHWKKFSSIGLLIGGSFVLKFAFAEADEAPDLDKIVANGGDIYSEFFGFTIRKNKDLCYKRAKDNFLHYIRNLK